MDEEAEYTKAMEWLDQLDPSQGVRFTVDVTREGEHYLGDVPSVPGAHTYADSLLELGTRTIEVIRLMADLPAGVQVVLSFNHVHQDDEKPTSVLITVEHYEQLIETIEDLQDRLSFYERAGDTIPVEQLNTELDSGG